MNQRVYQNEIASGQDQKENHGARRQGSPTQVGELLGDGRPRRPFVEVTRLFRKRECRTTSFWYLSQSDEPEVVGSMV